MATNTQFSIAIHLMTGLAWRAPEQIPSVCLAGSVNTSPAFVRRILAKLSKAGLVHTAMGKGGACWLGRPASRISLLDIYQAVDSPKAFAIHHYPANTECKVSAGIKSVQEKILAESQAVLEKHLDRVTLADVVNDLKLWARKNPAQKNTHMVCELD